MAKLYTTLSALSLALILGHGSAAAAEGCVLTRLAAFDLVGDELGSPVVAGSINGKATSFILDTGGFWSVLSEADAAGIPRQALPPGWGMVDAADAKMNTVVKPREPMIEKVKLPPIEFFTGQVSTIGANLLAGFDLEIDPIERKASLFKYKTCGGESVVWPHQDLAVIPFNAKEKSLITLLVVIDGKRVEALVDTGAVNSELDDRVARSKFDLVPGEAGTEASGSAISLTGRTYREFRHRFGNIDLGGVKIAHPWIRIGAHGHSFFNQGYGPPLILGMDILSQLHIYIAYKEHNLYLTTIQGDIAAGRTPPDGQSPSNRVARWNARELVETAWNAANSGKPDEAASALDQAVALTPDDPEVLLARAQFRLGRNDAAGAAADEDHALAAAPQSPEAHLVRGMIQLRAGHTEGAIAAFSRAIDLAPGAPEPLTDRAEAYFATKQYDLALADCNAALAASPGTWEILQIRGLVNLKSARLEAAIQDFDAAVAANPKNAHVLYGRSLAKRAKGDAAGADADLAAARAIRPDIEKAFGS